MMADNLRIHSIVDDRTADSPGTKTDLQTMVDAQTEQLENEIKLLKEEKYALFEKLLRMKTKLELSAGKAHDIRGLLTVVTASSEFGLGSVVKGTELEQDLRDIYASSKKAAELARSMLHYAQPNDDAPLRRTDLYTLTK